MPELLHKTPDQQPPSGGGAMFSAEEISALQETLNANREASNAQTNAEIAGALDSG